MASPDPWPPTLPEFRSRCLGIPSLQEVKLEVYSGQRSPFTLMVWQQIDGYLFKQASADKSERMLRDAYELAREMVMRGHALPEVPELAIEKVEPEFRPASKEAAEAALAEMEKWLR